MCGGPAAVGDVRAAAQGEQASLLVVLADEDRALVIGGPWPDSHRIAPVDRQTAVDFYLHLLPIAPADRASTSAPLRPSPIPLPRVGAQVSDGSTFQTEQAGGVRLLEPLIEH